MISHTTTNRNRKMKKIKSYERERWEEREAATKVSCKIEEELQVSS